MGYFPDMNMTTNTLLDFFFYVNDLTGNLFGWMFLLVIFLTSFFFLGRYPADKAFAVASFITSIISYLLATLTIVEPYAIILPTVATIGSIFFMYRPR